MYTVQRYRKVVFGILCVLLVVGTVFVLRPFWQAAAWGVALSIIVYPLYAQLNRKFSNFTAAGITTTATLLFIIGPLLLVGLLIYGEVDLVRSELQSEPSSAGEELSFTKVIDDANNFIQGRLRDFGITGFDLKDFLKRSVESISVKPAIVVERLFNGILTFTFALVLLFFLLRDGHRLRIPAFDLIPLSKENCQAVLDSVYDTVHATFYGIVLVALLQGTVAGITYWILGVPAALLLGVATVVLCTIPFVGAPFIWVPVSILFVIQGEWGKAVWLTVLGIAVIGTIDNIVRPIIIGARIKIHPILVFFSLIGGVLTLGAVGIIAGPVLLILAFGVVNILREMAQSEEADIQELPDPAD